MTSLGYFDRKRDECLDLAAANDDPLVRAVYLAMADEFRGRATTGFGALPAADARARH